MSKVSGHQDVHTRFLGGLSRGRLHHAWLLAGPAGIGKAMLAFELSRDYLCEKNRDAKRAGPACGECHACHMMTAGSHPDFLRLERLEGKRDLGVGQVREMLSFLSLSGAESNRRVVLVGGMEQMNQQAANALLKGLEEPASGSLLLMTCQNVTKLPATVRSRCLLQNLLPLGENECRKALLDMGLRDEVLEFAVLLARGAPGKVYPLTDDNVASALLEWRELNRDIARVNIGKCNDWISRHAQRVPHNLIVDVVLNQLEPSMWTRGAFDACDALIAAAGNLAAWPAEVIRRSLRPAPTLLAHMLALRIALRNLNA